MDPERRRDLQDTYYYRHHRWRGASYGGTPHGKSADASINAARLRRQPGIFFRHHLRHAGIRTGLRWQRRDEKPGARCAVLDPRFGPDHHLDVYTGDRGDTGRYSCRRNRSCRGPRGHAIAVIRRHADRRCIRHRAGHRRAVYLLRQPGYMGAGLQSGGGGGRSGAGVSSMVWPRESQERHTGRRRR